MFWFYIEVLKCQWTDGKYFTLAMLSHLTLCQWIFLFIPLMGSDLWVCRFRVAICISCMRAFSGILQSIIYRMREAPQKLKAELTCNKGISKTWPHTILRCSHSHSAISFQTELFPLWTVMSNGATNRKSNCPFIFSRMWPNFIYYIFSPCPQFKNTIFRL
jgi:hypothetical protein